MQSVELLGLCIDCQSYTGHSCLLMWWIWWVVFDSYFLKRIVELISNEMGHRVDFVRHFTG